MDDNVSHGKLKDVYIHYYNQKVFSNLKTQNYDVQMNEIMFLYHTCIFFNPQVICGYCSSWTFWEYAVLISSHVGL